MKKEYLLINERLDDLQINNLHIIQHPDKYCFTTDAVLLANYVKAKKTDKVVDLCSGSGVIGILVQTKTGCDHVYMVELQEYMADMSLRSVMLNKLQDKITVVNKPLQGINKEIGNELFEVVVCNPPYKIQNSSKHNENYEIAISKHEITVKLEEIIAEATRLLKYGGYFYTINKEERLTDIIVCLRNHKLEPKEIMVVPSKKGSSLVMIKAKKGGSSGIRVNVLP